jgi:hypothetical protein
VSCSRNVPILASHAGIKPTRGIVPQNSRAREIHIPRKRISG